MNIIPKHAGHATVASRELQCAQRVESADAAAPQLGQFNDWAAMRKKFSARASFRKRRVVARSGSVCRAATNPARAGTEQWKPKALRRSARRYWSQRDQSYPR